MVACRIPCYRIMHRRQINVCSDFSRYLLPHNPHDTIVQVFPENRITYPALIIAVCVPVVKRIYLMIDIRIRSDSAEVKAVEVMRRTVPCGLIEPWILLFQLA